VAAVNFDRFELFRYQLSLRRRVRIGPYVNSAHPGLLLCLVDADGVKGWGDISPLMGLSRESLEEAEVNLRDMLRKLRGLKFPDDPSVLDVLDPVLAHALPSVRCGLEMAVLNLLAEKRSVPLHRLWLEKDVASIPISALLAGTTDEIVGDAGAVRAAAYTSAKIKVGGHPVRDDVDRVKRVHEALGTGVRLRIDANRAWRLDEGVEFAEGVRGLPIDYIEEPMDVPLNIPAFHGESGMAIALDETLADTPYSTWGGFAGVKALVVKPTVLGGIRKVSRIAEQARRSNLAVVTSAVYESGVGIMALAHAAAVWGGPDVPAGIGTYRAVDWDVLSPRLPMESAALPLLTLNMKNHPIDRGTLLSL